MVATAKAPGLTIIRRDEWIPAELRHKIGQWTPKSELGKIVRECFKYLPGPLIAELLERITRSVVIESSLSVIVFRHPDNRRGGGPLIEDHGVVSRKLVTTAGVGYLVDAFQNLTELENLKYHALGTSSQAEAAGDTGPVTELTTQYNPDNTRATGTTVEGASANIFRTVGTNTLDEAATVQEHAVMSQAAAGGGVCLDRSLTGAQTLSPNDGLQSTYELTCTAGG